MTAEEYVAAQSAPAGRQRRWARLVRRAPDRRHRRAHVPDSRSPPRQRLRGAVRRSRRPLAHALLGLDGVPSGCAPHGRRQPERAARRASRSLGHPAAEWNLLSWGEALQEELGTVLAVIDLEAIDAIDVHVHAELSRAAHDPLPPELREAADATSAATSALPTADDVAAYYREREHGRGRLHRRLESRSGIPPLPERGDRRGRRRAPRRADPVRLRRPGAAGRGRAGPAPGRGARGQGASSSTPTSRRFFPNDRARLPALRGDRRGRPARAVPHRATPASARACRAAAASA